MQLLTIYVSAILAPPPTLAYNPRLLPAKVQGELLPERQFCVPAQAGGLDLRDAGRTPVYHGPEKGTAFLCQWRYRRTVPLQLRSFPSITVIIGMSSCAAAFFKTFLLTKRACLFSHVAAAAPAWWTHFELNPVELRSLGLGINRLFPETGS